VKQRTFVMIKPDGVNRGLIGEIISTFERVGLHIVNLELRHPEKEIAEKHYPDSEEWLRTAGNKALTNLSELGLDPIEELGTENPIEIGLLIKKRLVKFLCSGNVVIMVLEGNLAISNVRRLIGNTLPIQAEPSTIRGRYCIDSPDLSFDEKRPVLNLIHASGNENEAEDEIRLWFDNTIQTKPS
jgi:nucleoside-diphosphate kinase